MIQDKASYTAIHVAATRAAHLRFDDAPFLLEDQRAFDLLGEEHEGLVDLSDDEAHWVLLENRLFIPLRARWTEDRLTDAYKKGVRQYVILGAGLDSYAFRQPAAQPDLRIVEIDHPATQTWKRRRIEALGWKKPGNLQWIECDFEKTSMLDALALTDFDSSEPTFISWMGVTYYLERPIARAALADLSGVLALGSQVVFDFLRPYGDLSGRYAELEELSGQYLKGRGEPHVNRWRDHEVEADVCGAGFTSAEIENEQTLTARYGSLLERGIPLSERFGLAAASR